MKEAEDAHGAGSKQSPPLRLVYILGSRRAGGTILGVLLGAHPEIALAGELSRFPFPTWSPGRACSCGLPVRECPFWSSVVRRFQESTTPEELRQGQIRFESWSRLPSSLLAQSIPSRPARRHAERLRALVQAVAAESGRRVVVDASREALRGRIYALLRPTELETSYIHLVRDGRTYIHSELTRPGHLTSYEQMTWLNSRPLLALRWTATNLLAMLLCSGGKHRYLRITYEDLMRDPEGTLRQIGTFLGIDMEPVARLVRENQPLLIPHVISGNRLLKQAPTATLWSKPTEATALDRRTRLLFWALAGWLALLLGYRVRTA
jgi:hypothetical protein